MDSETMALGGKLGSASSMQDCSPIAAARKLPSFAT